MDYLQIEFYNLGKCTTCQKRIPTREYKYQHTKALVNQKTLSCLYKMCEEHLQMKRNDWETKRTIKYSIADRSKEFGVYKSFQCRRCVTTSDEQRYYSWNTPHTLRLHYAEKHS